MPQRSPARPVRLTQAFATILVMLSLSGCATKQMSVGISPKDAHSMLGSGDEITVVKKDRDYLQMKVDTVDEQAIVGEESRVMLEDVESITLTEDKLFVLSPLAETLEALSYLLILWPFFVF